MKLVKLIGTEWINWSVRFDGLLGWQACNIDANFTVAVSEEKALALIRAIKNGTVGPVGKLP